MRVPNASSEGRGTLLPVDKLGLFFWSSSCIRRTYRDRDGAKDFFSLRLLTGAIRLAFLQIQKNVPRTTKHDRNHRMHGFTLMTRPAF